jgi:hypothetical protein
MPDDPSPGPDYRYELKFVTEPLRTEHLRHQIRLNPAAFRQAYPARQVNNVYLDTYDLANYEDTLSGLSNRRKVRYRWYGEADCPGPGILEIKCKRNNMGWKLLYNVSEAPCQNGDTWLTFLRNLRAQLPPEGRLWLDFYPQPVIVNRYMREYYVSADGLVRLTLDTAQRTYDQRYRSVPSLKSKTAIPDASILELKCGMTHYDEARAVVRKLLVRLSNHSKYALGLNTLSTLGN